VACQARTGTIGLKLGLEVLEAAADADIFRLKLLIVEFYFFYCVPGKSKIELRKSKIS